MGIPSHHICSRSSDKPLNSTSLSQYFGLSERRMITQITKLLAMISGLSVFVLASQYILLSKIHPFQDGDEFSSLPPDRRHGMPHNTHTHFQNIHRSEPFCLGWEREDALNRTLQPFDHWWVHHPTWVISNETDDMFCVEPGKDLALMQSFETFYDTQFKSGCGKIHWRIMWSSGWGADMMNVQVS